MRRRPFGEPPVDRQTADPLDARVRPRRRWRRWLFGLLCLAAILATYAVALQWFSQLVGDDVQSSIRALPTADDNGVTQKSPGPR